MREDMTAKDVLVSAKNLINIEGWIQYEPHNPYGYCIVGALREVAGWEKCMRDENRYNAYVKASAAVSDAIKSIAEKTTAIPDWNDSSSRTKQEVLDMFDKAVQIADGAR